MRKDRVVHFDCEKTVVLEDKFVTLPVSCLQPSAGPNRLAIRPLGAATD